MPRVLAESTAGWQEKYPQVELRHEVIRGHPVRVLSDAAQWALALVGSRGLGGFSGPLLGSVSQGLMHHGPVVVVPYQTGDPPDRPRAQSDELVAFPLGSWGCRSSRSWEWGRWARTASA